MNMLNWLLTLAVFCVLCFALYGACSGIMAIWRDRRTRTDRSQLDAALGKLGRSVEARNRKVAARATPRGFVDQEPPF